MRFTRWEVNIAVGVASFYVCERKSWGESQQESKQEIETLDINEKTRNETDSLPRNFSCMQFGVGGISLPGSDSQAT